MTVSKNGSNGSTKKVERGNTRLSPAKEWCFTLNNYTEDEYNQICSIAKDGSIISDYIVGKEIGEKGTPHLQGYIKFVKKHRPLEVFKFTKRMHWELCKGSLIDNRNYCGKEGNFITNIPAPKKLKILEETKLFSWQREIINIVQKDPDERTIHWYWESEGKSGKSTFAKYLCHKYNGVPVDGKKNDILYCAATFNSDLYIFDFERSMEDYISYGAMEKIKNGFYMCAKYESRPIIRNCPHIICFANFEPDYDKLSKDRWHVVEIAKDLSEDELHEKFEKEFEELCASF